MNPPADASPVQEINRLHETVLRQTIDSRECLHAALVAAWQAGRLLLDEKKRIRHTMGAVWGEWLDTKFRGSPRSAQNYMQLAESTSDVSAFKGLSLRQVYLRLGIATEPKSRMNSPLVGSLPPYVRLANKLLAELSVGDLKAKGNPKQGAAYRQDLRALYERLRRLFEPEFPANLPGPMLSTRNRS